MAFIKRLLRYNLWFEHDTVWIGPEKYLERWFVYLLGFTVRLHKFYRGDDDRAPHDHPWSFITFPLTGYFERVREESLRRDGAINVTRLVKPFRFHYRPATYQHIVLGSWRMKAYGAFTYLSPEPFYTIVLTSRKKQTWGFYPEGKFVYWKDFNASR